MKRNATDEEVLACYNRRKTAGESLAAGDIGRELGCAYLTVQNALKKLDPSQLPNDDKESIEVFRQMWAKAVAACAAKSDVKIKELESAMPTRSMRTTASTPRPMNLASGWKKPRQRLPNSSLAWPGRSVTPRPRAKPVRTHWQSSHTSAFNNGRKSTPSENSSPRSKSPVVWLRFGPPASTVNFRH